MHLLHLLLVNQKRDKTLIIDELLQQLVVSESMVQTHHAVKLFRKQSHSAIAYIIPNKHLSVDLLDKLRHHH